MMRKLLSVLVLLSLLVSLFAACSGGEEQPPVSDDETSTDQPSGDGSDNKPNGGDGGETEEEPARFVPLTVKNPVDIAGVTQRSYYPNYAFLVSGLTAVRNHKDDVFADPSLLRAYLSYLHADSQDLGIYADYLGHTFLEKDGVIFGAKDDDYAIGGGEGYPMAAKRYITVTDDNGLKSALQNAIAGDVICIPAEIVIDMSDFLLAGDTEGFTATSGKIEYRIIIPEGVTLMGERGKDGVGGGIIKITSYAKDPVLLLEKNARLTGLVIQGPDTKDDESNIVENHSSGILVEGDGAVIDNCEISGFFKQAITVSSAKDVSIHHNYIHHIMGESGLALLIRDASVNLHHNLFSRVSAVASIFMDTTSLTFENNVVVRNEDFPFFIVNSYKTYDETYTKARVGCDTLQIKNNTFLAGGDLIASSALCKSLQVENNLFAYAADIYEDGLSDINSVEATIYESGRAVIQNNVYDIVSPKVYSKKASGLAEGVALTPYQPTEVKVPDPAVEKAAPVVLSNFYYNSNEDAPFFGIRSLLAFKDTEIVSVMKVEINNILSSLCNYSNYLKFTDEGKITQTVDGAVYGPQADEKGSIGGGVGYYQIFTEKDADFVVHNKKELLSAVKLAVSGDIIYIVEDAVIDLSSADQKKLDVFELPGGVTLCSNRGYVHEDGRVSTGGVIKSTALNTNYLFCIKEDNARITGLCIQGPDPATHLAHNTRSGKMPAELVSKYYNQLPTTRGVGIFANNCEVDNCEVAGFTSIAIALRESAIIVGEDGTKTYVPSTGSRVHHNYIHHNQISGLGYGVSHEYAYSEIYCNMFNYNRHSIHGTGVAQSGYHAYNNIEMGNSIGHYFDMHGGKDRKDGTDIGGEYVHMNNNAFLGEMNPYYLRGVPVDEITFNFNVVYYGSKSYNAVLTRNHGGAGAKLENVKIGKNLWNISNSKGTVVTGAD